MTKPLSRELVLIAIVAVVAVVGVVSITKISSAPDEFYIQDFSENEMAGEAFNRCNYYITQYEKYTDLVEKDTSYLKTQNSYADLVEMYCS